MAPGAESHEARWGEEAESNVEAEMASSSGTGSEAASNAGGEDQGWQQVSNPKKERRREKQLLKRSEGLGQKEGSGNAAAAPMPEAFLALEREAQARNAARKARNDAWTAASAAAANGTANGTAAVHPASEGEDDEENGESDRTAAAAAAENGEVKKKPKKVKKPKVSIAAAAASIDTADLAAFLAGLSDSFEPDTQLIRCVDYFVKVFTPVSVQISWETASKDPLPKMVQMPIEDIPENVRKVTSNWLAQKPVASLSQFTLWALNDVLFDAPVQQKGGKNSAGSNPSNNKTKVAVLVVLALLLRRKCEALLSVAEVLRAVRIQGPGTKLYVLTWMYGQVAQGDLLAGLSLWVQNLLPLTVGQSSTVITRHVALQFFESIILAGEAKKTRSILMSGASRKERLVPPPALISLLHMAYPVNSSRTKATERFLAIYPTVKEVALGGSARSKALKSVAHQLLPLCLAAAADDAPGLSREACSLFRWCLFQAPECYKQWEKLHSESLNGSLRVLEFIRDEWRETQSVLSPLKDLKNTIAVLRVQNRKMEGKGEKVDGVVRKADEQCKDLQKKMSRVPSCIKASATLACLVFGGYGLYLLNPNVNPWEWDGGLLLSKTHAFL